MSACAVFFILQSGVHNYIEEKKNFFVPRLGQFQIYQKKLRKRPDITLTKFIKLYVFLLMFGHVWGIIYSEFAEFKWHELV